MADCCYVAVAKLGATCEIVQIYISDQISQSNEDLATGMKKNRTPDAVVMVLNLSSEDQLQARRETTTRYRYSLKSTDEQVVYHVCLLRASLVDL